MSVEVSENNIKGDNMIKIALKKIINTDKDGKEIKDKDGNLTYIRYDAVVLSQLLNAVDSKVVSINEYVPLITLDDKSREALKKDSNEIGLTIDESALLKKLLNNPQNDRVSFSLFHIRTISAILAQLK